MRRQLGCLTEGYKYGSRIRLFNRQICAGIQDRRQPVIWTNVKKISCLRHVSGLQQDWRLR